LPTPFRSNPTSPSLPQGVTEIKTAELQDLVAKKTDMLLADCRPEARYAQSHLPGAVSISVDKLAKETGRGSAEGKG